MSLGPADRHMETEILDRIEQVSAADWNAVAGDDNPFLRHEFLAALERNACVGPGTGWHPRHLIARRAGTIVGAMPLYEKDDSWGEFVFDWSWARAYEQSGLLYYPKLVCAIPFSPVTGSRILVRPEDAPVRAELGAAAMDLAHDRGYSSLHVLFPLESELETFATAGMLRRKDCQFHWRNRGYSEFDEFLAGFSSKKRKNTRRERRKVSDAGITLERRWGGDISNHDWRQLYELHALSFLRRGRQPYLSLGFFEEVGRTMADSVLVVMARDGRDMIAAAIFFAGSRQLYGRYWGCTDYYDALHFETCYYQGIEICIENGFRLFEPGTQGEHKISRGFEPSATWSMHSLAEQRFHHALTPLLRQEERHVDRYIEAARSALPFKNGFVEEPGLPL